MKNIMAILSTVLLCQGCITVSPERANQNLNSIYTTYFNRLSVNGELIFSNESRIKQKESFFLDFHKKAAKTATGKGHWAYYVNKFPCSCKDILETGLSLPKDFNRKVYPKNRVAFPKKSFNTMMSECNKKLSMSPQLLENYNLAIDALATNMAKEELRKKEITIAKAKAKEVEENHMNYDLYSTWLNKLDNISKSNLLEMHCREQHLYNSQLFYICFENEHGSKNSIYASLENLWSTKEGRNHMNEIISLLDSDMKKSTKMINGTPVPSMTLTRIRFRTNLINYFKLKGFSVYSAVAVLN